MSRHRVIVGAVVASLCLAAALVARAADAPVAEWIWQQGAPASGQVVYFRKSFTVGGPVKSAKLLSSCDNAMQLFLNGEKVADADDWNAPVKKDVAKQLKPGENVIAVRGQNEDGVAAMVLKLDVVLESGEKQTVVTDETWTTSTAEAPAWQSVAFKPADWKPAKRIGKLGDGPWGDLSGPGGAPDGGRALCVPDGAGRSSGPAHAASASAAMGIQRTGAR